MARSRGVGKSIALLFLILAIILGGLLWFDYLGIIKAKSIFAPVYKLFGLQPQTSVSATSSKPLQANLEDDRLAKRLEALEIRSQELDKRESDIARSENANEAIARELEDRQKSQEEREKTFNNEVKKYDDRSTNIEQISTYLQNMPPKTAVEQLLGMDDQDIIDIFRKTDAQALASNTASMTSVWLMNMPSERAAVIQRKMASKPEKLD
ncbi:MULTISPECIES: periplasmic-type flagellar collar protein FlbB [Treponema]|uniref:periplasmic-type flagellar collar protein FlbB n=1 Tax=Treponema TaxID=157 RepID=UPI00257C1C2C|nr:MULTISPECIES: flagellar protein FlbB [Treponema]MBQ9101609.1 flagellar protein FlbB [Treponema sp.]MDY3707145.1 flagellar protein FlbB [Treponema berlinense]